METNLYTADKIILFIPKNVIDANDYSFALNIFDDVLKNPALIRKFKNQVTIGFDGYDDDSKEVFEIIAIRNFIQQLTLEFPFWFYFINLEDHSLRILLLILCKFDKIHDGWKIRINHDELDTVTHHLLKNLITFYTEYRLPEQESVPQIGKILDCIVKIKGY